MQDYFDDKIKDYLSKETWTRLSDLKRNILIWKVKNLIAWYKIDWEKFEVLKDYFDQIIENKEFNWEWLNEDDEVQIEELRLALVELWVDLIPESPLWFNVSGWYIVTKQVTWIDFHGLFDTKLLTKDKFYKIWQNTVDVLWYKNWDMRYNINLEVWRNSSRIQTIHIWYNWWNVIKLFNQRWEFLDYIPITHREVEVEQWRFNKNWSYYRERYTKNIEATINNEEIWIKLNIIYNDINKKSKINK
jgi:hypothetical protein